MIRGSLSRVWDDYLAVLREDAHQLIAWSYSDTRDKLAAARDEYDITGLIASAMHDRINSPQTPERFTFYSVHNERPISPGGELGKARPKLDIQIERCGIRPKRFYTIEAKRLRDDVRASVTATLNHYFGAEGVGRFVSGRYEGDGSEAAMLGCIQAHDAAFWFQHFKASLEADVIPDLPDEATTVHQRMDGTRIRLMHLVLNCK
jgi:hypothetical protein